MALEAIKHHVEEGTVFEEYWPDKHQLTGQKGNSKSKAGGNGFGFWTRVQESYDAAPEVAEAPTVKVTAVKPPEEKEKAKQDKSDNECTVVAASSPSGTQARKVARTTTSETQGRLNMTFILLCGSNGTYFIQ